ncbi:alpha/beta hydrolase [Ottowia thiooxydans]|uniref:alpha/beta hydrolase n=1 Tax=Ottowia thiooxydans TaxID=219182 RepID=UPI00040C541B|nr:alpha/beta hydrolase [Ottowia thiooxydans]
MSSPAKATHASRAGAPREDDWEYQYVTGQARASFPALLEEYRVLSSAAEALGGWLWDTKYGEHPRETFDFRPAKGEHRGTLIYLHAGYWQSRDKSQFCFLVPGLNDAGFHVVLANYPLCPEVSVQDIIHSVCRIPPAVRALSAVNQIQKPLVVAGHSAGGHLAVEIALHPQAAGPIDGVLAISGIYDLTELVGTTLNKNLQLTLESARLVSPLHRLPARVPRGAFVVGGGETRSFKRQNLAIADAWRAVGECRHAESAEDDHFMVLQSLCQTDGLLRAMLMELAA